MLRFQPDGTTLIVQDNGCGIGCAAEDLSRRHFGLQGIRERVDKLGGVLSIDTAPGGGTRLSVTVPARRLAGGRALAKVAS